MIIKRQNSRFIVMAVGSKGSGKSALFNSLINKEIVKTCPTSEIEIYILNLDFGGTSQKICFIDTPGLGLTIDDSELQDSIIDYIKDQFDSYIEEETKIRRNVKYEDTRVHCLVYLILATGNGLKQRDIAFLKKACNYANIIPIISKTEGMTKSEIADMKKLIKRQLEFYKIRIFDFNNSCESESAEGDTTNRLVPFACVFPEKVGEEQRIRKHPMFVCEVDNPAQSDYSKLRDALLSTHIGSLIEVTDSELYESYRADALENILHE